MIRAAWLTVSIVCATLQPATAADPYYREDLRIAAPAAGPRGLEAMLLRPAGTGRFPLALISQGAPRNASERAGMSPYGTYHQALEFARRGFAALVVMRRGFGDSGGDYAESSGPCGQRDYSIAAKASVSDLRAAIDAMKSRTDVSTSGMIAVGASAGGFASVALTSDPPAGLAAAISFAGGRGSRTDNDVCDQDALIREFATLGRTSRIPMLWIYARNDKFFWPDLAHRMHAAFTGAGGRARFIDAPSSGDDGHFLFSTAIPLWTPMVDAFLRDQNLGTRDLAPLPAPPALPQPTQLNETGRKGFTAFLSAGPHNAFAVSPRGGFAWRSGRRSDREAADDALAKCAEFAPDCTLYAVDGKLAAGSRY